MSYAQNTSVPVERSKCEIETILARYGADSFGSIRHKDHAAIMFTCRGLTVQFVLPNPTKADVPATDGRSKIKPRSDAAIEADIKQEERRRWRALALVVKAKMEAVESRITTFEREFLAHIVMKNGTSVGDAVIPALVAAAKTGTMPTLSLLSGPAK